MKLTVIASGSKGNSYILESAGRKLILDAGVPFHEIQKGLNFDLSNVVGCLVTHEHKDHSKAVSDLTKAGIDCYMSMGTLQMIENLSSHRLMPVILGMEFEVDNFTIVPFSIEHDGVQPLGFLIFDETTHEKLLYLTDSYYSKYIFTKVNYFLVECNYCKESAKYNVESGYIPEAFYRRLLESHFELQNVKKFLQASDLSATTKIILCHLSDANSDAKRMIREVNEATGIDTVVADKGLVVELQRYPY